METNACHYNLTKIQNNIAGENVYLDSYPAQIHFLMIDKCNVKCIMCGGDYFRSKTGRMITLEKFKTMAANLKLENAKAIVLAGAGDPLLNKDVVPIIQYVKQTYPHISITITTNGLALLPSLSERLIESGVDLVNISINSATRGTYKRIMQVDGFETVCKNAKAFADQRNRSGKPIAFQFSAAINELNIKELPRLVELGKEVGINSINLFYTRFYPERIRHLNIDDPANRLENSASLFFHQQLSDETVIQAKTMAHRHGIAFSHEPLFQEHAAPCACTWPMIQLMVGFDGEIYPCGGSEVHFREKVEGGVYDFGNALQNPVDTFWNNELYRALRISSRQGDVCIVPECHCCANTINPNDIRSHIMEWDADGAADCAVPSQSLDGTACSSCSSEPASPLISVIVPTFNRPRQLVVAVQSILEQTYRNFEIVVVNDCGADVEAVISPLNTRNNITYVKHGKNQGLGAARNTGIRNSSGQYIALLDDDDIFFPSHLETAVKELNESLPVVYTDAVRATYEKKGDGYELTGKHIPYSIDFDRNKLLLTNISPVNCFVFDKSLALKAGLFNETLTTLEDWDFWIRLSALTPFRHIKIPTVQVNWRTDGTTMTSSLQSEFQKNREAIYHKNRHAINAIPNADEIMAEFAAIWSADSGNSSQIVHLNEPATKDLVSIVILTFNQLEYTKECVESLKRWTPEPHEVVFVDNASRDGTTKWLERLVRDNKNYKLIKNKENAGFARGCNQGIAASQGEFILLLNNDVVVSEGWLSGLLGCLNHAPNAGIVGPMTNCIDGPQQVFSEEYRSVKDLNAYATRFRTKYRHRRIQLRRIIGFCMLFRRTLVEQIGMLDESFGIGNFEDDDFCVRAALAGHKNYIAGDVFIHHYGSRSFSGNRIDSGSLMSVNIKIFEEKWTGLDPRTPLGKKVLALEVIAKTETSNQKGDLEQAVAALIEAIRYAPEEKEIYYQLAGILMDAKLYNEALDAVDSISPAAKGDLRYLEIIAYCKDSLGKDVGELTDGILEKDQSYAPALNLKGVLAHKQGNDGSAEDFLLKAIAADPGYGEPYTNVGLLKWAAGEHDEALDYLEKGFILSPTTQDNIALYHSAVTEMKRFSRAEGLARDAVALHPANKRILFFLIDTLINQDKYERAMDEIENAMLTIGIDEGILSAALEIRNRVGIKKIDESKNRGTLSLCMIVKDEEKHIARCLLSAKPVVDEMIVVDTGSRDKTKDIAKAYGARVFDFSWTNDFSNARNHSLSLATGDWVLVLDADEVISYRDYDALERIVRKKPARAIAYSMATRNYTNEVTAKGWTANDRKYTKEQAGTGWFPSYKVRLFVNDKRIAFQNPVHEFVEASLEREGIGVKLLDIPVHHYGRFDRNKLLAKGREYFLLGIEKIEQMKGDIKALKELAVQASELGEFETGVELWKKVIDLDRNDPAAFLNISYAYMKMGKYEEALSMSRRATELDPTMKEAVLNYAGSELIVGEISKAISALKNLMQTDPDYPPALALAGAAYYVGGQKEKGFRFLERLRKKGFNCAEFLEEQYYGVVTQGKLDQGLSLLEVAMRTGNITKDTHRLFAECQARQDTYPAEWEEVLSQTV
jgi:glycosyltransferase involved in cell wall biosynthesis/MoaA/NifB/PqqE/SkfB family radical SAM enzyme